MRNLKQTLQKINWFGLAPLFLAVAMAFAPVMSVTVVPTVGNAQLIDQVADDCPEETGVRCTEGSIVDIFRLVINWALAIAFILAVIFLIYGGFQYIFAGGNEDTAKAGRTTIFNALIGIVIIVLSYIIVQIVYRFVSGQGNGAFGT